MAQEKKAAPDWERIEADYRAGLLSVREIAASQGITHGAINKRAKRDGWARDLKARIQAKADALVSKREVSTAVSTKQADTERAIIEANAEAIANVRMAHRSDIRRARDLCMTLLRELQSQTGDLDLFEQLANLLHSDEDGAQDKRMELFNRVLSLPGRVDSMKKLAETLKNLVGVEREAYGIAEAAKLEISNPDGSLKGRSLSDFYEDFGVSTKPGAG